jgi:type I restriction enzyme S subunit
MSKTFPMVPLGNLLTPISRPETVNPDKTYRILGAHWYAEGLYIKEEKLGIEIQADRVYRIKNGDFVYNRLFAWKGSFAVATAQDDYCYVSNEFPTFAIDDSKVSAQYLRRYFCRASAWEEALGLSSGGTPTSRNRLKEDKLLTMRIPLPSLEEQQRIVAQVEEFVAEIGKARGLHQEAIEEREKLKEAAANALFSGHDEISLPLRNLVTVLGGGTPSKANPFFWEGTIPWISPKDMKVRDISDATDHISEQAIVESPAKLIDPGAVLIVVRGMILSHTVPSAILRVPATINQDMKALIPNEKLLPEYLQCGLWALNKELLNLVEKSTHDTRKLETTKLLAWKIPVPPLSEQKRIVTYLDDLQSQIDSLKRMQAEISVEIDSMLPSILDKAFKGEL